MRHKLWLVIVILLLAAAGLFAFAATGHTYFAALLALIAALIVFYRFAGRVLKIVVTALLAIGVVVFVIIEIPIVKAARTDAPADCGYIVVLGAGLHGDVPSLSLRNRLDAALAWLEAHPDCVAVVSGGQGPGETMTEGEAMQIWLEAKGVDPSRIIVEDRATSTMENLEYSFGRRAGRQRRHRHERIPPLPRQAHGRGPRRPCLGRRGTHQLADADAQLLHPRGLRRHLLPDIRSLIWKK